MLEHGILQSRYFVSLEEAIDCVRQPEILNGPTKDSKRHGITTYREIRDMMNSPEGSKKLANDFNRDADLDKLKDYENKLEHGIRYESGVSDKSEVAVSVLKNMPEDTPAQIRDSGTMISLICGEYFEERVITGNRWLEILDKVVESHNIDRIDQKWIILIKDAFGDKSEQQLAQKFSLSDVVNFTEEINDRFYDTIRSFSVTALTVAQSALDTKLTNKQDKPWLYVDFYTNPSKVLLQYKDRFCGKQILDYICSTEIKGLTTVSEGMYRGIIYSFLSDKDPKKILKKVPLDFVFMASHEIQEMDDLASFSVKIAKKNSEEVEEFFEQLYSNMVKTWTYQQVIDFIPTYENIYVNENWKRVTKTLVNLRSWGTSKKDSTAFKGLYPRHFDTGIWLMAVAAWFVVQKRQTVERACQLVADAYISILETGIEFEQNIIPTNKYFGTESAQYKSAGGTHRYEQIFRFIPTEVDKKIKERSQDRTLATKLGEETRRKFADLLTNNQINDHSVWIFELSTDVGLDSKPQHYNLTSGQHMHWMHTTPHTNNGNAQDGFLGFVGDNLGIGKMYYWKNYTQKNYIEKIIEKTNDAIENAKELNLTLYKDQMRTSVNKLLVIHRSL